MLSLKLCSDPLKANVTQPPSVLHTAKNQYRKLETNNSRKGIAQPQSQFPHSRVCERFIYSHDWSAYSAAGNMWTDPGNIYNYPSQTHECGNWDWGRAIPRKGIHKWDFRCRADGRKTKREAKGGSYYSVWYRIFQRQLKRVAFFTVFFFHVHNNPLNSNETKL